MSPGVFLQALSTSSAHVLEQCFPLLFPCQWAKRAQPSALGSILQHAQLPASASLNSPRTEPGDAAISAELGHRAWKKREGTQVTETLAAHTMVAQNLGMALWKYYLWAGGPGRWRKCCQHSFIHTVWRKIPWNNAVGIGSSCESLATEAEVCVKTQAGQEFIPAPQMLHKGVKMWALVLAHHLLQGTCNNTVNTICMYLQIYWSDKW